jgi:phosphatidylserine/phosphatidylglycerophosphate/cardiolipin synthase-like enzyme
MKVTEAAIMKHPEYKTALDVLAEQDSDFVFPNESSDHAALVMEAIISHSKEKVRIFEAELSGDLLNKNENLLAAIDNQVRSGVAIHIVLQDSREHSPDDANISHLKHLFKTYGASGSMVVKKASNSFVSSMTSITGKLSYVTTGDCKSFRLEAAGSGRKAMCSFNRPNIIKSLGLIGKFDAELNTCDDYFAV